MKSSSSLWSRTSLPFNFGLGSKVEKPNHVDRRGEEFWTSFNTLCAEPGCAPNLAGKQDKEYNNIYIICYIQAFKIFKIDKATEMTIANTASCQFRIFTMLRMWRVARCRKIWGTARNDAVNVLHRLGNPSSSQRQVAPAHSSRSPAEVETLAQKSLDVPSNGWGMVGEVLSSLPQTVSEVIEVDIVILKWFKMHQNASYKFT